MRKRKKQTKLSRTTDHRNSLLINLSQSLFKFGKITTTLAKAKALRPFVEPLVTRAKKGDAHARKILSSRLYDAEVVNNLVEKIGPRFQKTNRMGGYTRIIKIGPRKGDGVEQAIIEFVDQN